MICWTPLSNMTCMFVTLSMCISVPLSAANIWSTTLHGGEGLDCLSLISLQIKSEISTTFVYIFPSLGSNRYERGLQHSNQQLSQEHFVGHFLSRFNIFCHCLLCSSCYAHQSKAKHHTPIPIDGANLSVWLRLFQIHPQNVLRSSVQKDRWNHM
jgi:hypothetical protein